MRLLRVALFVCVATLTGSAQSAPVVTVTGGQVRGVALAAGGAAFKGIPFAAPPIGERRWRGPMPVEAWSGVREATAFGPICAQFPSGDGVDSRWRKRGRRPRPAGV